MKENTNPMHGNNIIVIILLLIIGGLVTILLINHHDSNAPSSSLNTGSSATPTQSQQLVACQNAAHQKYDPEIAAAMSNGTSQQPVTMEQQALSTCQTEYSAN